MRESFISEEILSTEQEDAFKLEELDTALENKILRRMQIPSDKDESEDDILSLNSDKARK